MNTHDFVWLIAATDEKTSFGGPTKMTTIVLKGIEETLKKKIHFD